jgi:hypothetical protein
VFADPTPSIRLDVPQQRAEFYTLTSGEVAGDARSWTLSGSNDGETWTVLDSRAGETFDWRLQTRPFKIQKPGGYANYRLDVTANSGETSTSLAEVELLGHPPAVSQP